MRKKPKLDLGLNAYEELFMDKNERIEASLPKIYDIPIKLIDNFPAHPFKVKITSYNNYIRFVFLKFYFSVCNFV